MHTAMHKTNDKSTVTLCIYIKVPSIMTVSKGFKVPNELLGQIQHTRNPHKVESNLSVETYTLLASYYRHDIRLPYRNYTLKALCLYAYLLEMMELR